jgi:hypothetical protein
MLHTMAPALAQKGPAPTSAATVASPGRTSNSCDVLKTIPSVSTEMLNRQLVVALMKTIPDMFCMHWVDSIKPAIFGS